MGSAVLSMLFILFAASGGEKSCILTESGPNPFLIRIFDTGTDATTYGHGSLIRQDKVLSTCTPFKTLPKDLVNGKWRLSGYNFEEKCEQRRHPLEIEIHDACRKAGSSMIGSISLDLAIWTVEPFDVEGNPFLWGNGKLVPPSLTTVKTMIHSLVDKKMDCSVALFMHNMSESAELQPNATVEFLDQSECVDMLKNITSVFSIEGGFDTATENIFCVHDKGIKWLDSKDVSNPFDADWYSGAAVIAEDNLSNNSIPVGFISRAVTVDNSQPFEKNFRIILGLHNGVFDFLRESGIKILEESSTTITNHAGVTESSCELSEFGPYPYLIRISGVHENGTITYGHGSLLKENKVLSTCTPFKDLPTELVKSDWKLTGYNLEKQCSQSRVPTEVVMHETCRRTPFPSTNVPITHDFAMWTVEAFAIAGMPFLWGNGKPQPPPQNTVKSIIDSLLKFQKALVIGLFNDSYSEGPELQSDTKVNFIDWFTCLDMLQNVTSALGDMTKGLNSTVSRIQGFYDYFCGYDVRIQWVPSRITNRLNADWYSGAAVMYERTSGNKVPIGLLSRGVTVSPEDREIKNFRVIMGFHKGFYDFLSDNGIEPTLIETEFKQHFATSVKWRHVGVSRDPHYRRSRRYNHQSRLTSWGLWMIASTLLVCMY